jgi:hypothetical protein
MDSTEKKGLSSGQRVFAAFRRSGYLFALAFAFRLQLWLLGQPAPWTDMLRVDVLNAMGFSIAVFSVMAFFRTAERVRLCAVLGLGIAFAAPLISQLDWSGTPWLIRAYLVPDYHFFGFFPWGAYLAFGMSAGSVIRLLREEYNDRAMQWAALLGGALILGSQYFAGAGYSVYAKSDYWLNSPAQILTKLGVLLLMMSGAFVWTRYGAKPGWSWVRQFGTTSLVVYWVHIELVYGRWMWFFKNNLDVPQTILVAGFVILLMLGISTLKTYRHRIPAMLNELGWSFGPGPESSSGD